MTDQRMREIISTALRVQIALKGLIVTNKHVDDTAVTILRLIRTEERSERGETS